jgi:hypothetical protein
MRSNNTFERTVWHRGRAVLAINCVLGGAEWTPCQAAQLNRWPSHEKRGRSLNLRSGEWACVPATAVVEQALGIVAQAQTLWRGLGTFSATHSCRVVGSVGCTKTRAPCIAHQVRRRSRSPGYRGKVLGIANGRAVVHGQMNVTANNAFERTVGYRGPRLAAARASRLAAKLGR